MDYDVAEQNVAVYGDNPEEQERNGGSAGNELKHSNDDSFAGKLFVGGIAWETGEESFRKYFSRFGEIADCVIMMDKVSGRPRGFGFVTFADPEVANKVLEEDHVIDGRTVEVKRTVPKEDMQVKGAPKTKKIFVGGLPVSLTEDDLKEYFSSYGHVVEHQIMLDRETGRSRGFGFVTFASENAVEEVLNSGRMHEIHGKQVEIKKAEPKRAGAEHASESRQHRGGSGSRSYNGFGGSEGGYVAGYGRGSYGGYGGYGGGGGYGGYGNIGGSYGGGGAGYFAGYGGYGYGFGFSGPMYGAAGYGGASYGAPGSYGGPAGYAGGRGYTSGDDGSWYGGSKGSSSFNAKGYDSGGSTGGAKAYADDLPSSIGFLGLGIMGTPMAQNLLKAGCDVTVWNRTKSKCEPLISLGAKYKSSPEEVAASCDVTFAMLADPESAADVACGQNGAAKGMGPGKGYVDVSTVDVETSKLICEHIRATGAHFLEAPVSGSKKPAEDGQLIFLTAGDSVLYEKAAPLLDIMGKSRFYLGEVGNGAAMKLVVNMVMGSMMASFSEGIVLSEKVGLDPSVLVEVISQGAISAPMYAVKGPSMVKSSYPTAFPLKHQQKDLRLALGLAESVSQPIPIAAATNELYKVAKSHGLSDQDFSAVIEALKVKLQQ